MSEELKMVNVYCSLGHTIGNITSIFFNHILSMYPNNFFKTKYVDTTMSSRQFAVNTNNMLDMDKRKPIIALKPRIVPERPDFATTSFFNQTYGKNVCDARRISSATEHLLVDKDNNISVYMSVNRIKMTVEMTQYYESTLEQFNMFGYMNSRMQLTHPYREPVVVETQIPNSIIELICRKAKIENTPESICAYFNKYGQSPVIHKLKTSTGNYEYFFLAGINLQIMIDTPSVNEGDTDGQIVTNFPIVNNIELEFNYTDCFYLMCFELNSSDEEIADSGNSDILSETVIIPVMTTDLNLKLPQFTDDNWAFYKSVELIVEETTQVDDTEITRLFDDGDIELIDKIATNSKYSDYRAIISNYYRIVVYKNGELMSMTTDDETTENVYTMIWENMNLRIFNPDVLDQYVVAIYRNNIALNELIAKGNTYLDK